MSLNIITDRELDEETEVKYLTLSQEEHITFLIYRSNYRSFFPFAYCDKTKSERFVGYAGAVCSTDAQDDFLDNPFPKNVDIYMCANGMKSPYKRTADHLINIQNLVIDIDSHQSDLSIQQLNEHIEDFEKKLTRRLIIKPNLIHRTGRGLHLWYCIEPCHVSLNKICMSVIDMLCCHIEEAMKELNENELSVDKASSLKLNGLFRLPYSYNTKAKRWGECRFLHENLPNINDLRNKLQSKGYKSHYYSTEKREHKKVYAGKYKFSHKTNLNDYTPCLIHRKKFMDYLFQTRDIQIGTRDLMIFGMYATVVMLFDREEAQAYCEELNNTFQDPLSNSELCMIFREIDRKQHKFTVEKFFDFVNATEEEKAWFYKLTVKEERKREKRNAKTERNNKVKELYAQGLSIVAISKEMKLSRPTIYKIIQSE